MHAAQYRLVPGAPGHVDTLRRSPRSVRDDRSRHRAPAGHRSLTTTAASHAIGRPRGPPTPGVSTRLGLTNVLPLGPAITAWPRALPLRYLGHDKNHSVQPLSHVPGLGLPVMITGSPGSSSL